MKAAHYITLVTWQQLRYKTWNNLKSPNKNCQQQNVYKKADSNGGGPASTLAPFKALEGQKTHVELSKEMVS